MANQVYANGMEVACKSGAGKTVNIATDVCLSPPTPPAGPIPVPYPTTAMASDTSEGSKTVQITGKEVMLKNQSNFKKCTGDEAATKSLGMGVITHQITGKVYFVAWSMTVKYEGQDAVRHLDLMTHNHMSIPGDTPTWPYIDEAQFPTYGNCDANKAEEEAKCAKHPPKGTEPGPCPAPPDIPPRPTPAECDDKLSAGEIATLTPLVNFKTMRRMGDLPAGMTEEAFDSLKDKYKEGKKYQEWRGKRTKAYEAFAERVADNECLRARRCMLVAYEPRGKQPGCCPGQTPHHLVEAGSFHNRGRGGTDESIPLKPHWRYNANRAPCICVEGPNQYTATHGHMHTLQGYATAQTKKVNSKGEERIPYSKAQENGAAAVEAVFPESNCDPGCIERQLAAYHQKQANVTRDSDLRPIETGYDKPSAVAKARAAGQAKAEKYRPDLADAAAALAGK